MEISEVQSIELEILKEIHCFCENNELRYVLGYGTLLGAIRHNGFIPWDNDIDILMPRSDYERFLNIVKTKRICDHLYVEHYSNDSKYHYMCIRVCDDRTYVNIPYIREQPSKMGLWVDIFPMDGVGNRFIKNLYQKILLKYYWILFRADVYDVNKSNSKNRINYWVKKIAIWLNPNKNNHHNYRIDNICRWNNYQDCNKVAFLFGEEGLCFFNRQDIDNREMHKFEKYNFYIPKNAESFLRMAYGDFMQLPPLDKRITHNIEVYKQ